MKLLLKINFLLILLFTTTKFLFAQQNEIKPDEGMDIFLLTIATLFICVMIGAAIIGAMVATFIILVLFAFAGLGILSTSFAIGLYNRSIGSGFKAFLVIVFGLCCSLLGLGSLLLFNELIPLPSSRTSLSIIGITSGAFGGIIMGLLTFKLFQNLFRQLSKRIQIM
jgi:hypothetical protein